MQITKLRLTNYKGFDDSGWVTLPKGFTIVVGQNNAGKTALLESFRLSGLPSKPHRSKERAAITPLNPTSQVEFDLSITGRELLDAVLRHEGQVHIPLPPELNSSELKKGYAPLLFAREEISLRLRAIQNAIGSRGYPSLPFQNENTPQRQSVVVQSSADRLSADFVTVQNSANDTVPVLVNESFARSIYVFKAERLNIGRARAQAATVLEPDGSNLAAVLASLQGNPVKFNRFKRRVLEIFPNIREVAVCPIEADVEVRVWSVDSDRDDLGISLQESGTGLGQVLAILYVAETVTNGVVVIDEPSTFLHPGAAKKLIEILGEYESNQYVLATHSAELISTALPATVLLVTWDDGKSKIESLSGDKFDDVNRVLSEVGVAFSDVFGYDTAIWVEGQTEEICFPLLLDEFFPRSRRGSKFVAVINTGDFEKRGISKKRILEIYERLSSNTPLLPAKVIFSFDREAKSQADMDEIAARSNGRVMFLPRRAYENYLVHPEALAAVINQEMPEPVADRIAVANWIEWHGAEYARLPGWQGSVADADWLRAVDAPKLLHDLFLATTESRLEYRKTRHSVALTKWLVANDKQALSEIAAHVRSLRQHIES